ncbi:MAG: nucleotidyltransferase family protein [Gaiellaceae bacterium]
MRDAAQALGDRLLLGRCLGVDLAQQRLPEVGERGAGEAADESLRADDADLGAVDVEDRPAALQHRDVGLAEDAFIYDVDLFARPEDVDDALEALGRAGLKTEKPPERWLYKAYDEGGTLIDLIFRPSGGPVSDEYFSHAEELEVMGAGMQVASLADVMTTKLLALSEQEPDFTSVLEISRMLREQINWHYVRERTQDSPFAKAFFTLVEELGIVERTAA